MQKIITSSRALYEQLKAKYPKSQFPNVIITESFLFLMKSIQNTITVLNFDVLTNASSGTPPTVIEQRLNMSDRFCVKDMAMFLMKTAAAGGGGVSTSAEINNGIPRTYPNATVFANAGEALNLESVYNGFATIIIDSIVYYQKLDLRKFYRVPTSQQGVAVSTVAGTGVLANDGWDILNYAYAPVVPQFEFNGSGNNQFTFTNNNPTNLAGAVTSQNWMCASFRGFLIQNVNGQTK